MFDQVVNHVGYGDFGDYHPFNATTDFHNCDGRHAILLLPFCPLRSQLGGAVCWFWGMPAPVFSSTVSSAASLLQEKGGKTCQHMSCNRLCTCPPANHLHPYHQHAVHADICAPRQAYSRAFTAFLLLQVVTACTA